MGVEMSLGQSHQQASGASTVLSNRITAYESMCASLESFIGTTNLQGKTYSSAKAYSRQVLVPLLKGCILLDEAIKEACAKLPSEYRVQVDQIDLREDDLRDKIQRAGLMASRYEYLATLERQKETPDLARASHLSRSAGRYMEIEQRLQEKLQKLLAFNSSSVHIFAHIQPLLAAVQQGLKQTNGVWQADKKEFRLPDVKDMAWTKTVEEKWRKRELEKVLTIYEQLKEVLDSDVARRLSQIMGLLPDEFTDSILKADGFWEILSSVEKSGAKGQKAVDLILQGLVKYESLGQITAVFSKLKNYLGNILEPVKTVSKWGLNKVSGIKSLEKAVTTGKNLVGEAKFLGKGIKTIGKVGTVFTFASLAYEGISSGIEEYSRSQDFGKAVGKGSLDMIASVGPLEGATIGAAVASVIPVPGISQAAGAVVGFAIGTGIQALKLWKPKFFDDPIKGTEDIVGDIGKGIESSCTIVSNTFGGIGKALGFG